MNAADDPIFQQIKAIVIKTFRLPDDAAIGLTTTSADVEGWDSLSHAVLIMNVEEAFHTDLPLERVYALKDVGELANLVREATSASA
jgi:acyl carrier protein